MAEVARPHHYYETSLISIAINIFKSLIVFLVGLRSDTGNCTAMYDTFIFQYLATVCERQNSLYLHVLCGKHWLDCAVCCSSKQNSGTHEPYDKRLLAGKLML